jgi:hypothetical protein
VRKLYAATKQARARRYDAGRFSFNVAKGRCETCEGEGYVCVELLFLPSVYTPCPACKGARYNAKTLEIKIRGKSIADVLGMTVDAAFEFFGDDDALLRSLRVLREVGLGYIRLGQSATELSGGEAQRVKLAPSSSARNAAERCTFSTSRRPACIRPTWKSSVGSFKASSTPATPSSWWSTTCRLPRTATGSSTSVPAPETRVGASWHPGHRCGSPRQEALPRGFCEGGLNQNPQ